MRILFVTSLYSGLNQSIRSDRWAPSGMPAIAKLFEGLHKRGISFDAIMNDRKLGLWLCREEISNSRFGCRFVLLVARVTSTMFERIVFVDSFLRTCAQLMIFGEVRKMMRKNNYDLLYVDRANSVVAWLATMFCKIPVILRYHGVISMYENAMLLRDRLLHPFKFLSYYGKYSLIIASNDGSPVDLFLRKYRRKSVPYEIMLSGVDKEATRKESSAMDVRHRLGIVNNSIVIVFLGLLSEDKGIVPFLHVVQRLRLSHAGFHILVVGDGEMRTWAKAFIAQTGLESMVTLVGQVPHEAAGDYLRTGDIFVSLNSLGNLCNTVLEAIHAGLATVVLGPDSDGIKDISTARLLDDCVVYVQRNHVEQDLEKVLRTFLSQPNLVTEYQQRARDVAGRILRSWGERIDDEINLMIGIASHRNRLLENSQPGSNK